MGMFATMNSFNAGELSQKMLARSDVSQYSKGCQTLRNFLVTPCGSVERRPGTIFLALTKYTDKPVRVIPFVFSSAIAYLCEFGDFYIRFYRNHEFVAEIPSPYGADDVAKLNFVQSADVMFLAHPQYMVRELKRVSATEFILEEFEFKYPPVLSPNLDQTVKITPSARTGDITLTATEDLWETGHVGSSWNLCHVMAGSTINQTFTANGTSGTIEVYGYWNFTTHGAWNAVVKIQRSTDSGSTWMDFRTFNGQTDRNVDTSGEETEENVLYRVSVSNYSIAADTYQNRYCKVYLNNTSNLVTGVVKITEVVDARNVSGTVMRKLGGTSATYEWNEAAWSGKRGFPRAVAFFEERLVFGGTSAKPNTVWASKTADWNDFKTGSEDDAALEFMLASDTVNEIMWLCQHEALIIGTTDSEWTMRAADSGSLTATSVRVRRQSVYGASSVPARMAVDTISVNENNAV